MSVLFQQGFLWPLLILVAGPLLVHLLARTRPPVVPVSSIEFLRPLIRQSQRIKKPQDWLLFVLRTLLVLALVLMFLKPVWYPEGGWAGSADVRTVILVVDASASMAYGEDGQSRFSAAVASASDLLAGLKPGDRANIIWMKHPPEAVFPEPGVNHAALRQALREGGAGTGPGRPAQALALAGQMLGDAEGRKELYILSDFQSSQWESVRPVTAPDVRVAVIQPPVTPGQNTAVTRLSVFPPSPLAGEDVQIFAGIENYGAASRRVSVYLQAGEKREHRDVILDAWSETTLMLNFTAPDPGDLIIQVALDEDDFPVDDRAETMVSVLPYLRVGLVEEDSDTAFAWRQAIDSLPWARVEPVSAGSVQSDDSPGTIISVSAAPPQSASDRAMVWHPVGSVPASRVAEFLSVSNAPAADVPWLWEETRESMSMELVDPEQALFSVFEAGTYGDPSAARAFARLRIPPDGLPASDILIRYRDGVPALVREPGPPSRILWNIPLSRDLGTMQNRPEWVALLGELLLASRPAVSASAFRIGVPGDPLMWDPGREILLSDLSLRDPDGTAAELSRPGDAAAPSVFGGYASRPGIYTWTRDGQAVARTVIRFPVSESDLRCLEDPSSLAGEWAAADSGRTARILNEGVSLWSRLLGLIGGLVLLEGAAVWWARRS